MTRRMTVLTLAVAIALIASAGAPRPLDAAAAGVCDANPRPANLNFTLKDMHGHTVHLAAYKGKVILLDFWATWCGPCKLEIPELEKLQAKYGSRGLAVLGVSVDDPVRKLPPFAKAFKMNYPVLVGLGQQSFKDAYGPLWGIPVSFVIGRDGLICRRHLGISSMAEFEKEIKALL